MSGVGELRIGMYSDTALPRPDGIAVSQHALAEAMSRSGAMVELTVPSFGQQRVNSLYRTLPSFQFPNRDYRVGWLIPWRLDRRTEARGLYDIVHIQTLGPIGLAGLMAAKEAGIPVVFTWHMDLLSYRRWYPELYLGWLALNVVLMRLYRLDSSSKAPYHAYLSCRKAIVEVLSAFDMVVTPTVKVKKALRAAGFRRELLVLPSPTLPLPQVEHDTMATLSRLGLQEDARVVLAVGRMSREKNPELLLRAFALLAAWEPRARLVLVGSTNRSEGLIRLAKRLAVSESIRMTGPVERRDLASLYEVAYVVVIASLTETQSLVAQEAEEMGVKVIVVDPGLLTGAHVRHRILAEPKPEPLSAAMLTCLRTRSRNTPPGKASDQSRRPLTAEGQAAKLLHLYRSLID